MENLSNEQIIGIIEFYKKCGISEEAYLSKDGALDLFTLLKIEPEFDEDGNRVLTPYEQLEMIPKFEGGEEVPLVFAIKNRVKKVSHGVTGEFVYGGAKKSDSMEILHKFKQDYFNAIAAGDYSEAQRTFDFVNKLTGGKAEEVIGINYKNEMFYAAEGVNVCFECNKQLPKPAVLHFKNYQLPVYNGMKVYLWHIDSTLEDIETIAGEIVANPQNPQILGLRNTSTYTWKVNLPDGSQKPLAPGSVVPIKDGFVIDFFGNNQSTATMKI